MNHRIYADFQNLDDHNRLRLVSAGTLRDLERLDISLRDGLELSFYADDEDEFGRPDDVRVDGVVQFDEAQGCWVATVDWSAVHHASDESTRAAGR
jgi:hypothetical protein